MSDDQPADAATTSDKIRAEALALIARHGFAAVSMRQIAGAVGVQVGTLYLHVADKQALLFELLDAHLDALLAGWAGIPAQETPQQALRAFVTYHIGFHLEQPEASAVARLELRNLTAENAAAIDAKRRAYAAALEEIIAGGVEAEAFSVSDLGLTTAGMLAMLDGAMGWSTEARLPRPRVERICWRLARRLVGG